MLSQPLDCRTSQQASSKYSPFELLYMRKARLPIEIVTSPLESTDPTTVDVDQYMERMLLWADEVNAKAKENITQAQAVQKKVFDAKHQPPAFKVGDSVWVYNSRKDTRKGGKLACN